MPTITRPPIFPSGTKTVTYRLPGVSPAKAQACYLARPFGVAAVLTHGFKQKLSRIQVADTPVGRFSVVVGCLKHGCVPQRERE